MSIKQELKMKFVIICSLIAVAICGVSKEKLQHQIATLEAKVKTAEEFFTAHLYSPSTKFSNQVSKLADFKVQIESTNAAGKLLGLHLLLNGLSGELTSEIESEEKFLTDREALKERVIKLHNQSQTADKALVSQTKQEEAQELRMQISFLLSLEYRIVNAHSAEELTQAQEQLKPIEEKIVKLIEQSH